MGKDYLGADQRKVRDDDDKKDEKPIQSLDEGDIALLKAYGKGPYSEQIKSIDEDIKNLVKKVNELNGVKESDTGLAAPALFDSFFEVLKYWKQKIDFIDKFFHGILLPISKLSIPNNRCKLLDVLKL